MSHIFISYSRKDLAIAEKIIAALAKNDLEPWIDWKNIPKGEQFEGEIQQGIEEADAFLFLVSPDSVESKWCNKEIDHAVKNGKRILPIVIHDTEQNTMRLEISERNWIFCREEQDDFDKAIEETQKTIHTDYGWLKYHTKLQVKALDWERTKDNSRLLRGTELLETKQRVSKTSLQTDPQLTNLQQKYIQASEKNEERLKKRIALAIGMGFLIVAILSVFAMRQRNSSINAQKTAVAEANSRATAQANADQQTRISLSRKLAAGANAVLTDRPQQSMLLSVEALHALKLSDPMVPSAEQSLRDALLQSGGLALGQGTSFGVAPVMSLDNHWLAAGQNDGTINLWDLTSDDLVGSVMTLTGQGNPIQAITITDDSHWLIAAVSETVIQLWDLSDFKPNDIPLTLSVNECPVYNLKASPDGHWLIIVCANDTVKVWDLILHDLNIPPQALPQQEASSDTGIFDPNPVFITSDKEQLVSISADSRWFVMASRNIAYVWDLNSPGFSAQPIILEGFQFPIAALTISPDSRWLVVADAKTILLWNLTDPAAGPAVVADHFQLSTIAFTADGGLLAAGNSDGTVRFWNLTSADMANDYFDAQGQAQYMNALAFSPDGHWMITASSDIRLMDISEWRLSLPPLILDGYENPVSIIRISSNSRWLLTLDNDTALRLWDLSDLQPSASPITLWENNGNGSVRAIATSPAENHWLATAGGNGVALWDLTVPNFQTALIILSDKNVNNLAISPDNCWLAAGSQDGPAFLWDLNSSKMNKAPLTLAGHVDSINAIIFSNDNHWLATASGDQSIRLWSMTKANPAENPVVLSVNSGSINNVSFSADGHWLVAVAAEDTQLWDLTVADPSKYIPISIGKEFPVDGAAFSPDSRRLAIGRDDVRLLDLTTPELKVISTIAGLGVPMAISPDNRWLLALNFETPQLLDLVNLTPILLPGHEGRISSMAFSSDSHWLVTGSWDDTARIWDLTAKDPASTAVILHSPAKWLPHITHVAITPDNHWIITGVEGGHIYLWTLKQAELVDLACKTTGRNLYKTEWDLYFKTTPQKTCPQWPIGQ